MTRRKRTMLAVGLLVVVAGVGVVAIEGCRPPVFSERSRVEPTSFQRLRHWLGL